MCLYHLGYFMVLHGDWNFKEPRKMGDIQATAISVSNRLSFTSDPGISHLLPAPMKLWEANILACKEDRITDLS